MVQWTNKKQHNKPARLILFTEDTYLERTARPIYAITFLIPFIILYEIGTIAFNTGIDHSQIRVVSFLWIQQILGYIGFTPRIAWIGAPLAVLIILFAMQITSRSKWKVRIPDHFYMVFESIMLAIPLIVLSLLLNRPSMEQTYLASQTPNNNQTISRDIEDISIFSEEKEKPITTIDQNVMGIIVTGIGAGIYEELVFRLVMITIFVIILADIFGLKHSHAVIISVIASSLFFSLHHHIVFLNGQFTMPENFSIIKFVFRTFAGIYFAILYAIRGFGITAGTHAFYDILIAVMNTIIFE